ncbi:MAG: U3 small nucleolar RNA-associated protein 13, partial [Phylliscum demangeonii]
MGSEGPERDLIPALQRTFKPHLSPVITTAIDATGTLLATGAADGILKVWDIQGGYATHTFKGHSGIISALHFFEVTPPGADDGGSSSGKTTASRKKRRAREEAGQEGQKRFRLASGSEDGKVRVWDLINRSCVSVLDSHVSVVRGLDYSAEERALVSGSRDKTIIVWDARTWKTRLTIPVLEGVESAGFVARGKIAYTGGEHGKVRLWSVESGQEISQEQEVGGEGDSIVQIVYPHGQDWLLSVHADQSLLLHSLQSVLACSENVSLPPLPVIQRISGSHDEIIDLAYLMPDQSLLALATNSEDVRIVSVASPSTGDGERDAVSGNSQFGADIALLKGHEDIVICLDADWSGRWLATGAKDNTARLWHVDPESSNFTCFAIFTGHAESIGAIALPRSIPSSSAKRAVEADQPPALLLTGSQDQTIKCWTVLPNPQGSSRKRPASAQARYTRKAHDKDINAIDVNHNNTLFASASQDRTVKVWSVDGGEVQGVLRGHRRGVWSVRFAPKAAPSLGYGGSRGLLLTGSGDKTVKIWSVADYSCLRTLEGHTNSVLRVVWLPLARHDRGLRLASAGSDGLVKVWEAHTGEVSCTLDNHTDRIWALA